MSTKNLIEINKLIEITLVVFANGSSYTPARIYNK
ncbi:hypothetical protein HCH_05632 [Hahella chejuensis KCTC 2396]|uniref:Uncharacterized protein n=1 Tax=Hahella chejuensis (strain KCTC 2396) TaxID=349521 RepID=Q2SAN4_HAHCH|nr:hypothetical protein HCH_05632 [Hahella chejuensis KCTC 2396]